MIAYPPRQPAVKVDEENGTELTVYTAPGVQQYHHSACKAWVKFNGVPTLAINAQYNIFSVVRNGTGDYTITWLVPFNSANYVVLVSGQSSINRLVAGGQTATTVNVLSFNLAGVAADEAQYNVAAFGYQ